MSGHTTCTGYALALSNTTKFRIYNSCLLLSLLSASEYATGNVRLTALSITLLLLVVLIGCQEYQTALSI